MGCYNGKDLAKGLDKFKSSYEATEDFNKASSLAVKTLQKAGLDISRSEFDVYVRDNMTSLFTGINFEFTKVKKGALERVETALGVESSYFIVRPSPVGDGVQAKLDRLRGAYTNDNPTQGDLSDGESLLVQAMINARNSNDEAALGAIEKELAGIRKDGKSELEKNKEQGDAAQNKTNELLKSDFTRLSIKQQELRTIANRMHQTGEGDLDTLLDLASDAGIRILPINYDGNVEKIAARVLARLSKKERPPFATSLFKGLSRGTGSFFLGLFHDTQSAISRLSRRSNSSTTGGIGKSILYDTAKNAENDIIGLKENYINHMGKLLAQNYGESIPKFTGTRAKVKESKFYHNLVSEHAVRSAIKFPTGFPDKEGRIIELSKGELMQLYIDLINPDATAAMERNGMSKEKLDGLVNDPIYGLKDSDKAFAMSLVNEYYPNMWEQENVVFKRLYHVEMFKNKNYSGPISYAGGNIKDVPISPEYLVNMDRATEVLTNSKARVQNERPLDLNRNIFSTAIHRMQNSAKFVGGAEAYVSTTSALEATRESIEAGFTGDYFSKIKDSLDSILGLETGSLPVPSVVSMLKGDFVASTLALNPKLMFNQIASSVVWLIEDSFYSGLGPKPTELQGVNIAKLLYDNSAVLRDRYKGQNIIALDSTIEAAAYDTKVLLEGKSKWRTGIDTAKRWGMAGITTGDKIGVMWLGRSFFVGEYKKAISGGATHEQAIKTGVEKFNNKFTTTQQSYSKLDRSGLQNNTYGSFFTMFLTTPLQYGRQSFDAVDQIFRGKNRKGSLAYNLARLAMFHPIAGGMYWFITKGVLALAYGEWDDDEWEDLFQAMIVGPSITAIFIFGDIISGTLDWYDGNSFGNDVAKTAAFSTIEKLQNTWQSLVNVSAKPYRTRKDLERIEELKHDLYINLGKLRGIPANQLSEIYEAIDNVLAGKADKDDFWNVMGYSESLIEDVKGPPPKYAPIKKTGGKNIGTPNKRKISGSNNRTIGGVAKKRNIQ